MVKKNEKNVLRDAEVKKVVEKKGTKINREGNVEEISMVQHTLERDTTKVVLYSPTQEVRVGEKYDVVLVSNQTTLNDHEKE